MTQARRRSASEPPLFCIVEPGPAAGSDHGRTQSEETQLLGALTSACSDGAPLTGRTPLGVVVCVVDTFSSVAHALVQLVEGSLFTYTHERDATWNGKTYRVLEGYFSKIDGISTPVTIVELSEQFFDSKDPEFRWPKGILQPHGILQCYDVGKKKSLLNCPELLDAFVGMSIPAILVGFKAGCSPEMGELDNNLGGKLGKVFGVPLAEVTCKAEAEEVFCTVIRLAIQNRECIRPMHAQRPYATYKTRGAHAPPPKKHARQNQAQAMGPIYRLNLQLPEEDFRFIIEATTQSIPLMTSELGKWHGPEVIRKFPVQDDAEEDVPFVTAREKDDESQEVETLDDAKCVAEGNVSEEKDERFHTAIAEQPPRFPPALTSFMKKLGADTPHISPLSPLSPISPMDFPNYAEEKASPTPLDVSTANSARRTSSPFEVTSELPPPEPIKTQAIELYQDAEASALSPEAKEKTPTTAMAEIIADLERFAADLVGQDSLEVPLSPEDVSIVVSPKEEAVARKPLGNAVTLQQLVDRMTSPTHSDMHFTKIFLLIYRRFAKPRALLDALLERAVTGSHKTNPFLNLAGLTLRIR